MRLICLLCILLSQSIFAQSWIGYKYTGGIPTHRLFSRPAEYCNGFNIERFSSNILGEEEEVHDWRFGGQFELVFGNGIRQKNLFPSLSNSEQELKLSRMMAGISICSRYTYTDKNVYPYAEFSVGIRDFSTYLDIPSTTSQTGISEYKANQSNVNYCLAAGVLVPISKSVKMDLGINFNQGQKAYLYDFNSVYVSGSELDASKVRVGTSSLQVEVGLIFKVIRNNNNWSIFRNLGTGNSLLELLLF